MDLCRRIYLDSCTMASRSDIALRQRLDLFVVYFIPLPFAINVTEGTFISFVGSGMSESRGAF